MWDATSEAHCAALIRSPRLVIGGRLATMNARLGDPQTAVAEHHIL